MVFAVRKYPPFLAVLGSALFAGILALFTQSAAVTAFVDDPGLGPVATAIKANFAAMATGFVSNSGVEPIDDLFSRGDGQLPDHRLADPWARWRSRPCWSTPASSSGSWSRS